MSMMKSIFKALLFIFPILSSIGYADNIQQQPIISQESSEHVASSSYADKWPDAVGQNFRTGVQTFNIGTGMTFWTPILGGQEPHDLVLITASYGRFVGPRFGNGKWYSGQFEVRGEVFAGSQVTTNYDWTVGLTPHLRYHFITDSQWIPYVDVGLGVILTEIEAPDLGDSVQFSEQAAVGVHYFLARDIALNFEGRFIHISSAGMSKPNHGVNTAGPFFGITFFF